MGKGFMTIILRAEIIMGSMIVALESWWAISITFLVKSL